MQQLQIFVFFFLVVFIFIYIISTLDHGRFMIKKKKQRYVIALAIIMTK